MKFVLVSILSLLVGGLGGYEFAKSQKTDWSSEAATFEKVFTDLISQQNPEAKSEEVQKFSACLAKKVVEHLERPAAPCTLAAPKSNEEALEVLNQCVDPSSIGMYAQICFLGAE